MDRRARFWLGISLLLHLAAAWLSAGVHDADEQFQIMEYLGLRLGAATRPEDMSWEYAARMRPWFQPMLYEALIRPLRALGFPGFEDPFLWAALARLASALIGWASVAGLVRCCLDWFEPGRARDWAVRLACLFFMTPYLHARTSSENLGGSLFLLGIAAWVVRRSGAGAGALMGLSFLARYQMGFAIAAFAAWGALAARARARQALGFGAAFAGVLAGGLALDRLGYGEWVPTPWNYLHQNLVVGRAAAFGVVPAHHYFAELWGTFVPIGPVLLAGVCAAWALRPAHALSVTSFAFVAGHSAIGHKEQRFLYPILAQAPVLWVLGMERVRGLLPVFPRWARLASAGIAAALLAMNAGALLLLTLKPASAQAGFYRAVYRHDPPVRELWFKGLDPYSPAGNRIGIYRREGMAGRPFADYAELRRHLDSGASAYLFAERDVLPPEAAALRDLCRREYSTLPEWVKRFDFLPAIGVHANRWSLFRCEARGVQAG